jgi:hypothetical protein
VLAHEELALVPGVAESRLPAEVLEHLPDATPGPPWHCRLEGVLWLQRSTRAAVEAIPSWLRSGLGLPITLGALVRYLETPVGPYAEVFAVPRLLRGGAIRTHVPFMAVDSISSLHGGRAHWALPKVLAEFGGFPLERGRPLEATGPGWWIRASPVPRGPAFPVRLPLSGVQLGPDGGTVTFAAPVRGRARLARIEVEVDPGCSLSAWLRSGRHLGLWSTNARLFLGPAHLASRADDTAREQASEPAMSDELNVAESRSEEGTA